MAGEENTATISTSPHLSLRAACVGFLSSTVGLTVVMVLLSHA